MIFYWLAMLGQWIVALFVMPDKLDVAKIERDLKCPVCGEESGRLRCVERIIAKQGAPPRNATLCQHTCQRCGARYYEQPVADVNPSFVFPSVARDEFEKLEDAEVRNVELLRQGIVN